MTITPGPGTGPLAGPCCRAALALAVGLLLLGCGGGTPPAETPRVDVSQLDPYDPHAFDGMDEGTLRRYLEVHNALAHDQVEPARQAARALTGLGDAAVAPLALVVADAADLAGARDAFRDLSEQVARMDLPEGFAVAFCPMAFDYEGASWVQKEGDIANPYYGDAMLRCGGFEEVEEDQDDEVGHGEDGG